MTLVERARELRGYIEKASAGLDDTDAANAVELFPAWREGCSYKTGDRVRYGGILWRVLVDHDAQATWTPDVSPSLFAQVLIPDPGVIPDWEQPGSTNGYSKGDKVSHNGHNWESLVDNNTWEPGVIGTENLWKDLGES